MRCIRHCANSISDRVHCGLRKGLKPPALVWIFIFRAGILLYRETRGFMVIRCDVWCFFCNSLLSINHSHINFDGIATSVFRLWVEARSIPCSRWGPLSTSNDSDVQGNFPLYFLYFSKNIFTSTLTKYKK